MSEPTLKELEFQEITLNPTEKAEAFQILTETLSSSSQRITKTPGVGILVEDVLAFTRSHRQAVLTQNRRHSIQLHRLEPDKPRNTGLCPIKIYRRDCLNRL